MNIRHSAIAMQKQSTTNVWLEPIKYATGDEFIEQCNRNNRRAEGFGAFTTCGFARQ